MRRPIYAISEWLGYERPGMDSLKPLESILIPGAARDWPLVRELLKHPAALGVYIAMLRAASKMFPRGVFINGQGVGFDRARIAREAGVTRRALESAWPYLIKADAVTTISKQQVADVIESLKSHTKTPQRSKRRRKHVVGEHSEFEDRSRTVDRRFHERRVATSSRRKSYPGLGREGRAREL